MWHNPILICIGLFCWLSFIESIEFFHGKGSFRNNGRNTAATRDDEYYSILGVTKDADSEDIKRAYRKSAIKMHPDKGGNAEDFKKLSEAYETLSDPQKRSLYDKFGKLGLNNNFGGINENEDDFASDFFQRFTGFGQMFSMPLVYSIELELEDLYKGRNLKITLNSDEFTVRIEPGMYEGLEIRTQIFENGYMRDVTFLLKERVHKVFKRRHSDLLMDMKLTLQEALFGFERNFTHLDGSQFTLRSQSGQVYGPDDVLMVDGLGMVVFRQRMGRQEKHTAPSRGRLFVRVQLEMPKRLALSEEERGSLAQLLKTMNPESPLGNSEQHNLDRDVQHVHIPVLSDLKYFGGFDSMNAFDFL